MPPLPLVIRHDGGDPGQGGAAQMHPAFSGLRTANSHILSAELESRVYKVTGTDPAGRTMAFACGTDEQALEKTWELARRGFRDVLVSDPTGRQLSAAAFERFLDLDYD